MPCTNAGVCTGTTCGESWRCVLTGRACGAEVAHCGCDGVTFIAPSGCATRPYAFLGDCEAGARCGPVGCTIASPDCALQNEVPEIVDGCFSGHCVPFDQCSCSEPSDCPSTYTCDLVTGRCRT